MKKNIIKIIAFFVLLFIILRMISYVFIPKNNTNEYGIDENEVDSKGILAEKDNSIDIVVYGDSESIASFIPYELWNKYGYTAYVSGAAGQSLAETCKMMYETLGKQKPKYIILESNNIFDKSSIFAPAAKMINVMLPIIEYHDRWKTLKKEDVLLKTEYTNVVKNKGYHVIPSVSPADDSNYMIYTDEKENIKLIRKIYIKAIKTYCDSIGAELLIYSSPSVANWNYKKHNALKEFCEEENIDFLDLNVLHDEIGIDWSTDTGDGGDHVNYNGALKVMDKIGQWLNDKNKLVDHRNDESYAEWNENIVINRE